MTPEERNLISGLFDRMRAQGPIDKEREADALIGTQFRQNPDAGYMLVQSVLIQEQALNAASDRVQQLEARVRDLESASRNASQSSGGSFLGGLFGGGNRAAPTSVPQTRPANSPWGQSAGQPMQPQYQQPPMQQGGYAQPAPARAGGGFMAQAMTTAAGVAGGMLAANAISNMLGGHHGHSNSGYDQGRSDAASDDAQDRQMAQDAQQDAQQDAEQDTNYADNNDPGVSPASDDSWGGGSDSTDV